jgi:hypothetical protein
MVLRRFVSGVIYALAVLFVLPVTGLHAATFREAPELAQRLVDLRPVYGWPASWSEPLVGKTIARSRFSGNSNDLPRVIAMNGVIEAGDLERFREILFNDPAGQYRTTFLALQSSPGGSLSEAKRIGEFIHEMIYDSPDGTPSGIVVFRNSACLSACAYLGAWAGERFFVEAGAGIGFHWPYLPQAAMQRLGQQMTDPGTVMDLAYEAGLAYTELALSGAASGRLIRLAFAQRGPENFYRPTTAADVFSAGFTPVAPLDAEARPITVEAMRLSKVAALCEAAFERDRRNFTRDEQELGREYSFHEHSDVALLQATKSVKKQWLSLMSNMMDEKANTGIFCNFGLDAANRLHLWIDTGRRACETRITGAYDKLCTIAAPNNAHYVTRQMLDEVSSN